MSKSLKSLKPLKRSLSADSDVFPSTPRKAYKTQHTIEQDSQKQTALNLNEINPYDSENDHGYSFTPLSSDKLPPTIEPSNKPSNNPLKRKKTLLLSEEEKSNGNPNESDYTNGPMRGDSTNNDKNIEKADKANGHAEEGGTNLTDNEKKEEKRFFDKIDFYRNRNDNHMYAFKNDINYDLIEEVKLKDSVFARLLDIFIEECGDCLPTNTFQIDNTNGDENVLLNLFKDNNLNQNGGDDEGPGPMEQDTTDEAVSIFSHINKNVSKAIVIAEEKHDFAKYISNINCPYLKSPPPSGSELYHKIIQETDKSNHETRCLKQVIDTHILSENNTLSMDSCEVYRKIFSSEERYINESTTDDMIIEEKQRVNIEVINWLFSNPEFLNTENYVLFISSSEIRKQEASDDPDVTYIVYNYDINLSLARKEYLPSVNIYEEKTMFVVDVMIRHALYYLNEVDSEETYLNLENYNDSRMETDNKEVENLENLENFIEACNDILKRADEKLKQNTLRSCATIIDPAQANMSDTTLTAIKNVTSGTIIDDYSAGDYGAKYSDESSKESISQLIRDYYHHYFEDFNIPTVLINKIQYHPDNENPPKILQKFPGVEIELSGQENNSLFFIGGSNKIDNIVSAIIEVKKYFEENKHIIDKEIENNSIIQYLKTYFIKKNTFDNIVKIAIHNAMVLICNGLDKNKPYNFNYILSLIECTLKYLKLCGDRNSIYFTYANAVRLYNTSPPPPPQIKYRHILITGDKLLLAYAISSLTDILKRQQSEQPQTQTQALKNISFLSCADLDNIFEHKISNEETNINNKTIHYVYVEYPKNNLDKIERKNNSIKDKIKLFFELLGIEEDYTNQEQDNTLPLKENMFPFLFLLKFMNKPSTQTQTQSETQTQSKIQKQINDTIDNIEEFICRSINGLSINKNKDITINKESLIKKLPYILRYVEQMKYFQEKIRQIVPPSQEQEQEQEQEQDTPPPPPQEQLIKFLNGLETTISEKIKSFKEIAIKIIKRTPVKNNSLIGKLRGVVKRYSGFDKAQEIADIEEKLDYFKKEQNIKTRLLEDYTVLYNKIETIFEQIENNKKLISDFIQNFKKYNKNKFNKNTKEKINELLQGSKTNIGDVSNGNYIVETIYPQNFITIKKLIELKKLILNFQGYTVFGDNVGKIQEIGESENELIKQVNCSPITIIHKNYIDTLKKISSILKKNTSVENRILQSLMKKTQQEQQKINKIKSDKLESIVYPTEQEKEEALSQILNDSGTYGGRKKANYSRKRKFRSKNKNKQSKNNRNHNLNNKSKKTLYKTIKKHKRTRKKKQYKH